MNFANPIKAQRQKVLQTCRPETRELIREFEGRRMEDTARSIMTWYELGQRIEFLMTTPSEPGEDRFETLKQIGQFLKIDLPALHQLRGFAQRFAEDHVREHSSRQFDGRGHMQMQHWLALSLVDDLHEREVLLRRVFQNSLTGKETRDAVEELVEV